MPSIFQPAAPTTFYARFFDAAGNVVAVDDGTGAQWYELPSFAFGLDRPATRGTVAGSASAAPLTLTLGRDSLAIRLEQLLASGAGLARVEVVGFADGSPGTAAESYVFAGVTVPALTRATTGDSVSLSYDSIAERVAGAPAATGSFILPAPPTPAAPAVTLAQVRASLATAGTGELRTLARFFDAAGNAVTFGPGKDTWVEVSGFGYALANSGVRSTAGDASLTLADDAAAVALERFLLEPRSLARVEVAEYSASNGALVRDTVLGTVAVSAAATGGSLGGTSATLGLSFRTLADTLRSQDAFGRFTDTAAGWDFAGEGLALRNVARPADTPTSDRQLSAYAPAAPTTFYVRFFDATGTVVPADDNTRAQWSRLLSFDVGTARTASLGQPTGSATASPLLLGLGLGSLTLALERLMSSGTGLRRVEVVGFADGDTGTVPTESYVFGTVSVSALAQSAAADSAATDSGTTVAVTLAYDALAESFGTTQPGATETFSTQKASTLAVPAVTLAQVQASLAGGADGSGVQLLARFFDANGTPVLFGPGKLAWVPVDGLSYPLGSNGVRIVPGDLSLSLPGDAAAVSLDRDLLAGRTLSRVEVAEYRSLDGALLRDTVFTRVVLDRNDTTNDGAGASRSSLGLSFATFADLLRNSRTDGTFGVRSTAGTSPDQPAAPVTRPDSYVPAAPRTFYARFTDAAGQVLAADDATGAQWLQPLSLAFGATLAASAGVVTGNVRGSPLQLVLAPGSLAVRLEDLLLSGAGLARVELVGFDALNPGTAPDEAYVFGTATVSGVASSGPAAVTVSLDYGAFAESFADTAQPGAAAVLASAVLVPGSPAVSVPAVTRAQVLSSLAPAGPDTTTTDITTLARFFDARGNPILFGTGRDTWVPVDAVASALHGTDRPSADDVSLAVSGAAAVTLAPFLLNGTALTRVELAEYRSSDGTLLRDTVLGTVVLDADATGFADTAATQATFGLSYRTYAETLRNQRPDGRFAVPTSVAWDFGTNAALKPSAIPADTYTADGGVACYCEGTLILTAAGQRPVEALRPGDRLVTADGTVMPVRWVGHRAYAGRFMAARRALWPVLIRAGALAPGCPARDLRVSPKHAMLIDGVLVPAELLVNGATILQPRCARVAYVHVELDAHAALLAEGAPSESFVDDGSRGLFHNAPEYYARHGTHRPEPRYCAPKVEHGPVLDRIRRRLATLAAA